MSTSAATTASIVMGLVVVATAVVVAVWQLQGERAERTPGREEIFSFGVESRFYGSAEMQGMRSYMEDTSAVLFVPPSLVRGIGRQQAELGRRQVVPHALFGVFDGHGGQVTSMYLRRHMLSRTLDICAETLTQTEESKGVTADMLEKEAVPRSSSSGLVGEGDGAVEECLYQAFCVVNREYEAWARKNSPRWNRSGSTAVVSLLYTVTDGSETHVRLATANAGDSRGVLDRVASSVVELSIDHKPNDAAERERVEGLGGTVTQAHPSSPWRVLGILATSRSFGDFALAPFVTATPDVRFHEVATYVTGQFSAKDLVCDGEILLLASDGFWDVNTNEQGAARARELRMAGRTAEEASRQLVQEAFRRASVDNITAMVVYLDHLLPVVLNADNASE